MVAFTEPPGKIRRSPHLRHIHRILATTLLPSQSDRPTKPIVAWKAWLFTGWLTVAALWGISRAIVAMF